MMISRLLYFAILGIHNIFYCIRNNKKIEKQLEAARMEIPQFNVEHHKDSGVS